MTPNLAKKVAAVVVTYNRKELLLENIRSLLGQTARDRLDILVIDNASTDGTHDAVSGHEERGELAYINTGANLGGAGGFQYGIREATQRGYGYIWVMDDDCMPKPDALQRFLEKDHELGDGYGFLSSKVLWKDGSICVMNVQRHDLTKNVTDFTSELVRVDMASFVSLFLPARVVREVGLPIKEFFIWTDDWEYTRRISRRYPCYLVNSSVVVHKSAKNMGANIATETPDRLGRFETMYRNDVYLYRREGLRGFLYETARLSDHVLRVLAKSTDSKRERVSAILQGTREGLSFNPSVEYVQERPGIRVLEAFGEPVSFGGEESYVFNTLDAMDRDGFSVDVLTPYFCDNERYRKMLEGWGGTLFELGQEFAPGRSRANIDKPARDFFSAHRYDIVHVHSGSISAMAILAHAAKLAGMRSVIVHAHIARRSASVKHEAIKALGSLSLERDVDAFCACSQIAATTMFTTRDAARTVLLKNGVDMTRFSFDQSVRDATRAELGIAEDRFVIGHVGRFAPEKNQAFLIRAFSRVSHRDQCLLMLVGSGDQQDACKRLVDELSLSDSVVFLDATADVTPFYQVMDLFALPSIIEGFPIVAVEAQAAGLPVMASDQITRSIDLTGNVRFLSLDDPLRWSQAFDVQAGQVWDRAVDLVHSPFDIRNTAADLRRFYLRQAFQAGALTGSVEGALS